MLTSDIVVTESPAQSLSDLEIERRETTLLVALLVGELASRVGPIEAERMLKAFRATARREIAPLRAG